MRKESETDKEREHQEKMGQPDSEILEDTQCAYKGETTEERKGPTTQEEDPADI